MKTLLLALLLLTSAATLSACGETVRGAGQDIEKMGKSIQNI